MPTISAPPPAAAGESTDWPTRRDPRLIVWELRRPLIDPRAIDLVAHDPQLWRDVLAALTQGGGTVPASLLSDTLPAVEPLPQAVTAGLLALHDRDRPKLVRLLAALVTRKGIVVDTSPAISALTGSNTAAIMLGGTWSKPLPPCTHHEGGV